MIPLPDLYRSRMAVFLAAAAFLTFTLVIFLAAPSLVLSRTFDGALVTTSILVIFLYGPGVFARPLDPADRVFALRLGIVIGWTCAGLVAFYRIAVGVWFEIPGRPPDDTLRELTIAGSLIATVLHISCAPQDRPWDNLRKAATVLGLGALAGAIAQLLRHVRW